MKAVVYEKYGSTDVLHLKEVKKPVPGDNEVLVKVHAASVNDWDWGLLRGKPFVNRLLFGLLRPKIKILGVDMAGRIEAVGESVERFQPGQKVLVNGASGGAGNPPVFWRRTCPRKNRHHLVKINEEKKWIHLKRFQE